MYAFLISDRGAITIDQLALGAGLLVVALGVVDLASEEGGILIDMLHGKGLSGILAELAPVD
ncbi:MAG: hypothetical protein AAF371_09085 [Pseudomonadota bacterium]